MLSVRLFTIIWARDVKGGIFQKLFLTLSLMSKTLSVYLKLQWMIMEKKIVA